ncbi:MAG TPA: hypothetical protein VJ673_07695 [Aromatoleum sp.]|uniref:hypothetical protein n=1 Tax=Aromatoleum sp. TaxID=2307007 RepID=UPI002B46D832|nr:hypothetical protein [Aromatoleum sp.]HJV25554.1 hypothetical protein [Aromatoleum sp.]
MPPSTPHLPDGVQALTGAIDDALSLLNGFRKTNAGALLPTSNPSDLLSQCLDLCAQYRSAASEPIRTVHHFACTGGTLVTKCIATTPNSQVLSEVDPLSTQLDQQKPRFAPTDIITQMRQSTQGASQELLIELFLNSIELVKRDADSRGLRLVVRDHAHSHYCRGPGIPDRPNLRQILESRFTTLSVLTVRHPLDSFLSLKGNGWLNFAPQTIDEYSQRYLTFLDAYQGLPVVRYEDLVDSPSTTMQRIALHLDLPFFDQFLELFSAFHLTGDSGRTSDILEQKPRRQIDDDLSDQLKASESYRRLLDALEYPTH